MRLVMIVVLYLATHFIEPGVSAAAETRRPNIVLILTDDQGYGDFGFTGNPLVQTPNLDRLSTESVFLTNFCVSPVCTPTRASLMTGRYHFRTGAIDTYRGRAMMDPEEVTLPETLSEAGYETGIFGKWHLGDCYPTRAMDQGFKVSLVLRGGGLGQPSDHPDSTGYFDPILFKNGRAVKTEGYCTDIFADAAIEFIRDSKDKPFFVYLPFNCPHNPFQVKEQDYAIYKGKIHSITQTPTTGYPIEGKFHPENTAKLYGMVTNIDENIGRILAALDELGIAENTILIFLTDNGPDDPRYNSIFRGRKKDVYEGGIRVPCLVRWKGHLKGGTKFDLPLAHIDLKPTIEDLCGVTAPAGPAVDGRSFRPALEGKEAAWPERILFFQWHRGDIPEMYRNFTARGPRYKLVQPLGAENKLPEIKPGGRPNLIEGRGEEGTESFSFDSFELYDIQSDPSEKVNIAKDHPEIVRTLLSEYVKWFIEVTGGRSYEPPKIVIGDQHSPEVLLTRQDWRGGHSFKRPDGGFDERDPNAFGLWETTVAKEGKYDITLHIQEASGPGKVFFQMGEVALERPVSPHEDRPRFEGVTLRQGDARLMAWVETANQKSGARYVEIKPSAQP